ncbi:MAG TPA: HAD family phosphatase, partial [Streptosporangiaceae bacterium]|nr:HAD family phosphatase [Streptosporangiaceae bacterium]
PILTAVRAWIEADGIDWESYRAVMRPWVIQAYDINGSPNPVHALERGMTGVLHTETASTARALQDLLGVPLPWSAPAT